MSIEKLLLPQVQKFILENSLEDENKLLLKYKTILGAPASLIVDQIIGFAARNVQSLLQSK